MAEMSMTFEPDYAVPPGWILEERLETLSMSQAEFARRCGRSPKLISDIIAGKAPVEPKTALEFEAVIGVDARVWLGIESDYRLHQARERAAEDRSAYQVWARQFPVKHLVERGLIEKPSNDADAVSKLLLFFNVANKHAWLDKFSKTQVAYRHSPTFTSSEEALATWLRIGEIQARKQECEAYNESAFKKALVEIRDLTVRQDMDLVVERMTSLCNAAGVAVVFEKPLPKTSLSGVARWLNARKALIQLSLRHKSDDHLWFSFFHESAHIVLHKKSDVFVDGAGASDGIEAEANEWARNFLVSRSRWSKFVGRGAFMETAVCAFAEQQGIAPGIVVGMLQHDGLVGWNSTLNHLKCRYKWGDE